MADEITPRGNREALARTRLRPRVLRDGSIVDLRTRVLGTDLSMPLRIASTAAQGEACAEGACATARAG